MPEKRLPIIVADTNVLISSLIGKRLRPFLTALKEGKFELLFSEDTELLHPLPLKIGSVIILTIRRCL